MGRPKDTHWRPKDIFLIPNSYLTGDSYPNKGLQRQLQNDGYGSCSGLHRLNRSWTIDELINKVKEQLPHHIKAETGIVFAKITRRSRRIAVHDLNKEGTVSDLEKIHGQGILVILQKPSIASPKKVSTKSNSTPHIKSPKKDHDETQLQAELDTLAQYGGISTAYLNCNSLLTKKEKLKNLLHQSKIDVMGVGETLLKQKHLNKDLHIPGYTIMARRDGMQNPDSNKARGGVLMYVKDSLVRYVRKCSVELHQGLEAVCIDIEQGEQGTVSESDAACKKRNLLRIINVYIPGSATPRVKSLHLTRLQKSIDAMKTKDKCSASESCSCKTKYVILGDFNCDQKNPGGSKALLEKLAEFVNSHSLTQQIKDFTRVVWQKVTSGGDTYEKKESLIDLVYTDDPDSVLRSGVVHITVSDHYMVYCSFRR